VYCVGFSQPDAGAAMTRHLLERGHRRIAFAAAQLDPRTLQRAAGYRRALQAAGLHDPALEWLNPALVDGAGRRTVRADAARAPGCDAVFFCNDDLAQGGLLAALRLGVAVPQRLAVAGLQRPLGQRPDAAAADHRAPRRAAPSARPARRCC
jgi:LacI family transcriptional regulator, gluconate utilization system Gnt-I transcriptional repressor